MLSQRFFILYFRDFRRITECQFILCSAYIFISK
nr:MAG TPA: hypothetical protein [Caudoviricetes sp.]